MADFTSRMVRAAKLEAALYEEVEADRTALGQAMLVVVLFGMAAGVGALWRAGYAGLLPSAVIELLGWYIWTCLIFLVGTKLLPQAKVQINYKTFFRTVGFSSSPGILRILGVIPKAGISVEFIVSVWMMIAMIIAVKQVFHYSGIWQAVAVSVVGWVIVRILQRLLFAFV